MENKNSVRIAFGRVDLVRNPTKKGKGLPLTATVNEVVFRNYPASLKCPVILRRAIRQLSPHLQKVDGWRVAALHPDILLGYSIAKDLIKEVE